MTKDEIKEAATMVHERAHALLCAADIDDFATVRELANSLSEDCQRVAHGVLKLQHQKEAKP